MEYRTLGDTELCPSLLGLGTSRLTSVSSGLSRRTALDLVSAAADLGINFIDTADIYGQGDSEVVIGEAIRDRRDRFIVATKAGYRFGRTGGILKMAKPFLKRVLGPFRHARTWVAAVRTNAETANVIAQDFSPGYVATAIEASLRRLRTDYLDIFYLHDPPALFDLSDELRAVLERAQRAGKVRHFGTASAHDESVELVRRDPLFRVAQTEVHPWRSSASLSALPAAGKGVVVHRVFAHDQEQRLEEFARRHAITPRQAILGFVAQQPFVSSVLTGTTNVGHLRDNIASVESTRNIPFRELAETCPG
ncbi:aldo/keto reductase [Mycoplana ramosa]|uniref:Aldo/keto reductase n=1 Tax=Mycoplana ramosa TaxID=40837 RepID=A0ABW3YWH9_MYCRA